MMKVACAPLDGLQLGERYPDDSPIDGARVLADKGLGCLLLILKLNQSLLFPICLKKFRVHNGSMLLQVGYDIVLCDVLWKCGDMDYLGGRTTVPVVLGCIAVEAVEAGPCILMGIRRWCDV